MRSGKVERENVKGEKWKGGNGKDEKVRGGKILNSFKTDN